MLLSNYSSALTFLMPTTAEIWPTQRRTPSNQSIMLKIYTTDVYYLLSDMPNGYDYSKIFVNTHIHLHTCIMIHVCGSIHHIV